MSLGDTVDDGRRPKLILTVLAHSHVELIHIFVSILVSLRGFIFIWRDGSSNCLTNAYLVALSTISYNLARGHSRIFCLELDRVNI